ncbi:MAG: hypothetical protein WDZ64_01250 [Parcubacteria group bacterium]
MEINLDLDNLHHAYLLIGDEADGESFLESFSSLFGVRRFGNPDFHYSSVETFGIEDARELTRRASQKAFGEKKFFFLIPSYLTLEAQNALLKTFEDPYPDTHFFLLMREEPLIESTLRSRMMLVDIRGNSSRSESREKFEMDAKTFLKSSLRERLNFAKKFSDEERHLSSFLDHLLLLLKKDASQGGALSKVYKARLFSDDRSASSRIIVEHLSLVL